MSLRETVEAKAAELGKHICRMTTAAGSGHPSSGLSLVHLVIALMYKHLRYDPADPWHPAADRLVLSEGHAVPVIYAAYADLGGVVGTSRADARPLNIGDLATLREVNSPLDGHPNPAEGFPFFDAATGSLGQGLSVAAGLALAARTADVKKRIFCIVGDGESREGQIWEAVDFCMDHDLANVCAIFNCNGQGQADYVSTQQSADVLAKKLRAAGWSVKTINGHDIDEIDAALASAGKTKHPLAIVASTTKGWGVSALADKGNHGKPLSPDTLDAACKELDAIRAALPIEAIDPSELSPPGAPKAAAAAPSSPAPVAGFAEAMAAAGLSESVEAHKLSTRRAYGGALLALGAVDERIVALDGDVSNSTFANFFAKAHPDRFFECKIAEQNMVSAAAGLAAGGRIPFASSFAKFIVRAYDQVEMAHITRANIKLVGSHSGVSLGADGPSQMGLVDVAFFSTFAGVDDGTGRPVCIVFQPSDAVSAYHCTLLMAAHHGMAYMRTHRPDVPLLHDADAEFTIRGSKVLREGNALTLVASGYMVHECLKALERLAERGLSCTLIDAYGLPPAPGPILEAAQAAGKRILTVEDNYAGSLGSHLAEAAADAGVRLRAMTCRRVPKSGKSADDVLKLVGLDADAIAHAAAEFAR